jgi:hypothetical protein
VLLEKSEFLRERQAWTLPTETIWLDKDSLGFTFCTVPVIYTLSDHKKIVVFFKDGSERSFEEKIDIETSHSMFNRDGKIARIEVTVVSSKLR